MSFAANRVYRCRRRVNRVMLGLACAAMGFSLIALSWIILTLLVKGGAAWTLTLFTEVTPPPGQPGGLLNAIVGSVLMVTVAVLIGAPVGILTGTYLAEYGRQEGWLVPVTRFLNDVLLSAPSLIIGLFVYTVYVSQVGHYSAWAGAVALAILVIPVVVRTTDTMLLLVPDSLREACAALGCPRWRMITLVCWRAARPGILTGILLALARISGETAPLLFTALSNQFMSWDMNAPMANLPMVIFQYAASPFQDWNTLAWAGAALLTLLVLGINVLVRILFRK